MAKKPRPAKPRVVVTRRLPPNVEARMAELFDAIFNVGDVPMDRTALTRAMACWCPPSPIRSMQR
jgi:glyoxylate reductase